MTEGYRDVDVKDMTSSWKDGLAFCALIHRFRPDLIDFDSLSKENVFENNQLAFDIAEKELNIPAFLDAPDMVAIKVPDRLSVVTYVSQYYNNLHDKPQLGGPGIKKAVATKRHQDSEPAGPEAKRLTPSHLNANTPTKERQVSMGDKCHICNEKVYLMERHVDKNKLYHRHCFRHSELSPTSKVFNKTELQKISDQVKSENDTNKQVKSDSDSKDFWKRRNEARKVEKMETEESLPSKDVKNNSKNEAKPFANKDINVKDKNIISDKKTTKEPELNKKDRPSELKETKTDSDRKTTKAQGHNKKDQQSELKLETKTDSDKKATKEHVHNKKERPSELKLDTKTDDKSVDPKPSPRKHKKDNVEPMDTSVSSNGNIKPVPSPRKVKEEKKKSPMNSFFGKNKEKSPDRTLHAQKLSSNSDLSPLSPPPLPTQPPPPQLVKSSLLSPGDETSGASFTSHVDLGDKLKPSVTQGRKSPQFNAKLELTSPQSTHSPDKGSSVFGAKFSPTFSDSSSTSESSNISVNTRESKISPKSQSKFISANTSASSNFVEHRSSNFSPTSRQLNVDEAIDLTKSSSKSNETVAVVFTPSQRQQEENDKQVLGGLLSNLANIRRMQKTSVTSPTDDIVNHRQTTGVLDNHASNQKDHVKSAIITKSLHDSDQNKVKHSTDQKETHSKQALKQPTDSNIPDWKRQLEKNMNGRPKSVDLLSDKKEKGSVQNEKIVTDVPTRPKTNEVNNPSRPKTVDLLSDKYKLEQKPQWQLEAEKRMEARKGGFVDPEKAKVGSETKKDDKKKDESIADSAKSNAPIKPSRVDIQITDDKRESGNIQKRQLPTVPGQFDLSQNADTKLDKKRISVNVKFDFSSEASKSGKTKPPRPPAISVGTSNSISPEKPSRPPPPLKDGDVKRLSPSEIQKQLTEIDLRLRDLEIRGRQLEDSIRKAQEEEDEKMMVEWFDLVNNKNELVRKEADLIYISRAQELEDEQNEIDRKLREMILKDEKYKTNEEKAEEEYLIQKKLDIINQRNLIVDSIDEDRIRYEEEDKDIAIALKALSQESGHITIKSTEAAFSKKKKKKGKLL